MKRTLGWHGTSCLGAACLAVLSGAAGAQNLPAPAVAASAPAAVRLQPVIISAERREENIKNVPVSASTISDEKLDALNSSGQDLQMLSARVPSLNVESSFGRSYPRLYIRGYGNVDFHQNASQPVSLVYDDVVLESSVLKGFPAFDLDRIEVLRGPQGTLFGRNTPAGVIKFDSVRPQRTFGGYVSVSDATYNTANIEGALNVPLSDAWAMRVSLLGQHRDDWIDNIHTGQSKVYGGYDDSAARMQFLYQPAADFSALANVHARRLTGSASLFRANAIQPGSNDLVPGFRIDQVETDGANGQSLENYGANLRVRYNLGRHTLHSITGLESVHVYSRGDIDGGYGSASSPLGGPSNVPFSVESADGTSNHRQFTQEFRVESNDPGPTNWQAGLYYFNEGYDVRSYSYDSLAGGAQTAVIKSTQDNVAWAAFGSVRHDVSEQLNLRGGLRYTRDRKTLVTDPDIGNPAGLPVDASQGLSARPSNSKVSWDLSALYKLSADTNLYSRLATAFRGATVQPAAQFNPMSVAQPETVVSVEGGVKSSLFDQRTRLSFGVYRFEVKNQQLSAVGGGSNQTTLVNAKQVIGQGVELDLESYLTDRLLVTLGASYNHTRIDDPNLEVARCAACTMLSPAGSAPGKVRVDGNPLPQAPRWVANFTARYGMPFADGELFAFTDWAYRGEASLVLYKSKEFVAKPLLVGGLRLGYGWADGKYEAALFGRNITNQIKLVGGIDFNNLTGFVNDFSPRIWGVQFKAKF